MWREVSFDQCSFGASPDLMYVCHLVLILIPTYNFYLVSIYHKFEISK